MSTWIERLDLFATCTIPESSSMVMGDKEKARDSSDSGKNNKPVAAVATKA